MKYDKLKNDEVCVDAINQYIELKKEIKELKIKLKHLQKIEQKNNDLEKYIWTTRSGQVLSIREIEESHLLNIISGNDFGKFDIDEDVIDSLNDELIRRQNLLK